MKSSHRAYDAVKRAIDVATSAVALIALSPVLLLVAAMVRISLGAPVLFRQSRPGLNGRVFTLYKFRTMRMIDLGADGAATEQDAAGSGDPAFPRVAPRSDVIAVASDAARLTSLGRLLRSTSLDELPELYNVLCGDMSLVGPRPLLVEYLDRYTPEQARRHEVRPGITGLAQVSGRNALAWDERFRLDVRYVDERSLRLDLWIAWRTVATVLSRAGVSGAGHATMEPFVPNDSEETEPETIAREEDDR